VQIREFCFPEDYPQVEALWVSMEKGVSLGRSDTPVEIQKMVAHDPGMFLVAEEDGKIVGTVIGGFDGRRGLICHLAVAASSRGRGIGPRLMEAIENRLRSKGCLRCYLLVTSDNPEGMLYHEKHGWERMDGVVPFAKNLA
jgi:ribosomal protein S18 acetylase RimI-like enzyme